MPRMHLKLTTVLTVIALSLLAGSALATSSFRTGRYRGTTSQKHKIVFDVGYSTQCNAATYGRRALCLSQPDSGSASIDLKCSDGSTNTETESVQTAVPRSGRIRTKLSSGGAVTGTTVVNLLLHRQGTITGSLIESLKETGSNVTCASGKVTFSAKR